MPSVSIGNILSNKKWQRSERATTFVAKNVKLLEQTLTKLVTKLPKNEQ
jgi:hypothetical protein